MRSGNGRQRHGDPGHGRSRRKTPWLAWTHRPTPGLTQRATHFAHKQEKPHWTAGHLPVVILGNHAFYRLPD